MHATVETDLVVHNSQSLSQCGKGHVAKKRKAKIMQNEKKKEQGCSTSEFSLCLGFTLGTKTKRAWAYMAREVAFLGHSV